MTSSPPLRCNCEKPVSSASGRFCLVCEEELRPIHPTAEPKSPEKEAIDRLRNMQLDNLELSSKIPFITPPVEGEWAERFDEKFPLDNFTPDGRDSIKSFITTLLHSEREKGEAFGESKNNSYAQGLINGRAEERERIAKMCEEMKVKDWTTTNRCNNYNEALSDLRDKLL